jgi:glycine oxidase
VKIVHSKVAHVKNWDVIIIGGGIIGLSLAIALRKRGVKVLVVERGEPGREASHAAAGMLADLEAAVPLQSLASAGARMYPEFVHELQDESGMKVDLRDQGTLLLSHADGAHTGSGFTGTTPAQLGEMEPELKASECHIAQLPIFYLNDRSVDPRALVLAALKAAKHRNVDISSGAAVQEVLCSGERVIGVCTDSTNYYAPVVVNCAGAWAGQVTPLQFPTRPVKGQMLAVVGGPKLRHVIRSAEVYLVPRTDGRIVIGATVEEAGYDKRTDPDSIQRLHHAAIRLVPALTQARMLEAWAGLRPGTPDDLPILGPTQTPGYFVATGHFRNGILLAPITAHLMAQVVMGEKPDLDLCAFSPARFPNATAVV